MVNTCKGIAGAQRVQSLMPDFRPIALLGIAVELKNLPVGITPDFWARDSPIQRVQIQKSFLGRDKQKLWYGSLHLRRNPPIAAFDGARRRPHDSSTYAMGEWCRMARLD